MPLTEADLKALKALYSSDSAAKSILDYFAFRQRRPRNYVTGLGQLVRDLSSVGTSRPDAIRVLRKLQEYGCGTFIIGRSGHESRFKWRYSAIDIGKAAAGGPQAVEKIRPAEEEDNFGADSDAKAPAETTEHSFEHSFHLRLGWEVKLTLPTDLTHKEAARLSEFVKTLPFEAAEG